MRNFEVFQLSGELKRAERDHERGLGSGGRARLAEQVRVEAASAVRAVWHAHDVARDGQTVVAQRARAAGLVAVGGGQVEAATHPRAVRAGRRRSGRGLGDARRFRTVQVRAVLARRLAPGHVDGQVATLLGRRGRRRERRLLALQKHVFLIGSLLVGRRGDDATSAPIVGRVRLRAGLRRRGDGTRSVRRSSAAAVAAGSQLDQLDGERLLDGGPGRLGLFELDDGADGRQDVRVPVGALAHVRRDRVARAQDADETDASSARLEVGAKHLDNCFDGCFLRGEADGDHRARRASFVRVRQGGHSANLGAGFIHLQLFRVRFASVRDHTPIFRYMFHLLTQKHNLLVII